MKLFLILSLLSCSQIALAQTTEEESLFPELSGFSSDTYVKDDKASKNTVVIPVEEQKEEEALPDEVSNNDTDLFKEKNTEPLSAENKESSEISEEEADDADDSDDKKQVIAVTINDVDATLTANRGASFCSAVFAVGNGLKKDLKSFSGTFTIGTMTKTFAFSNMSKQEVQAKKYTFVGESCEQIANEPILEIKSCQVEGWSEKKCKSKVQFIPIPKEQISE